MASPMSLRPAEFAQVPAPTPPFTYSSAEFPAVDASYSSTPISMGQRPIHPVPSMQAAFEESMFENKLLVKTNLRYEDYSPQHHRLEKVVAQVAFGMYLLHQQLAISESEVVRIMQRHVNEMDDFLSDTTELFRGYMGDIKARTKHLRLPIDSGREIAKTFDEMLMDGDYRRQLLEGNERVDHIVQKTQRGVRKTLKGVGVGLRVVDDLGRYLGTLKYGWKSRNLQRVFYAMVQNVEQWYRCLVGLHAKGAALGDSLHELKEVMRRVEKRALRASQKASERLVRNSSHLRMVSGALPASDSDSKPLPLTPSLTPILFTVRTTPEEIPSMPPLPTSIPRSHGSRSHHKPTVRKVPSPVSPLSRHASSAARRRSKGTVSPVSPLTNRTFSYRRSRPVSYPAASLPPSRRTSRRNTLTKRDREKRISDFPFIPPRIPELDDPVLDKIRRVQEIDAKKRRSKRASGLTVPLGIEGKREKRLSERIRGKEEIGTGVWVEKKNRRKRCSLGRKMFGKEKDAENCKLM